VTLTKSQKAIVWVIDIGFIVYWSLIILRVLPPEVMFEGYETPEVQAWNWSFLPLDIAAAVTGIVGQTAKRCDSTVLLTSSLVLTSVAGGMALSYWVVLGYFDILWWAPNLVLFLFPLWPLYFFITNPGTRP
jgi:hypothetical protein